MTCKLRQGEGEEPSVVVTVGEGPDSEGITSRSRLTASAVGLGVFETLRGDSEPANQLRKYVSPEDLRPHIALDIQRLGRILRTRITRRPVLHLFFDRITVQAGRSSSVFHEIRIRRGREGGPRIREIAQLLRDRYDLFPDGLSTLQRAYRVLAMEGRSGAPAVSPYALSLGLALFREGCLGLVDRDGNPTLPSFRGSGEDAARALLSDLTGHDDLELIRLGTTEPREGRPTIEVWTGQAPPPEDGEPGFRTHLSWYPWHTFLEGTGARTLQDPNLLPARLLLTRCRSLGRLSWIPERASAGPTLEGPASPVHQDGKAREVQPETGAADALLPLLGVVEDDGKRLEERLRAAGRVSAGIDDLFLNQVRCLKESILSDEPLPQGPSAIHLLDLLTVRIRTLTDRLDRVVTREILPALESRQLHLRGWSGLMHEDRRAILEEFSGRYLPSMTAVPDWGPAFVPEMPPVGCAVGLAARTKDSDSIRFFHLVLSDDTPSFLRVSGSSVVLPLEEVIRGYFFSQHPALERAETHLFRFRTAEVTVRETVPDPLLEGPPLALPEFEDADAPGVTERLSGEEREDPSVLARYGPSTGVGSLGEPAPSPLPLPTTVTRETRQSVVVKIVVHPDMPESHQARLLRALERQVSRKSPLIGWSDLYAVSGPMELSGLSELLD